MTDQARVAKSTRDTALRLYKAGNITAEALQEFYDGKYDRWMEAFDEIMIRDHEVFKALADK